MQTLLRELRTVQRLRATVYQLHQRETSAVLQPSHVRPGTGGIQERGNRVDLHWFWHGPASLHWSDWEGRLWHRESRGSWLIPKSSLSWTERFHDYVLRQYQKKACISFAHPKGEMQCSLPVRFNFRIHCTVFWSKCLSMMSMNDWLRKPKFNGCFLFMARQASSGPWSPHCRCLTSHSDTPQSVGLL